MKTKWITIVAVACLTLSACKKRPQIISQDGYGLSISMSNALVDGLSAVEMRNEFGMLVNDVVRSLPLKDNPAAVNVMKAVYGSETDFYGLTAWTNLQSQMRSASIRRR